MVLFPPPASARGFERKLHREPRGELPSVLQLPRLPQKVLEVRKGDSIQERRLAVAAPEHESPILAKADPADGVERMTGLGADRPDDRLDDELPFAMADDIEDGERLQERPPHLPEGVRTPEDDPGLGENALDRFGDAERGACLHERGGKAEDVVVAADQLLLALLDERGHIGPQPQKARDRFSGLERRGEPGF